MSAPIRILSEAAEAEFLAVGFKPLDLYPGSTRAGWRSLCTVCETEVSPSLQGIRRGRGCRTCAYRRVAEGNMVPAATAAAEMRAAGFEPLKPYPGAKTPWHSRCTACGEISTPRLVGVRQGYGCIHCARSAPIPPEKAEQYLAEAGLVPLEPYSGAGKPWLCRCTTCGSRVRPRLASVRRGHSCLVCSYGERGVRPDEPAVLYVVHNREYNALKPGIAKANEDNKRLKTHSRAGWAALHIEQFPTGIQAYSAEQQVLAHLRYDLGFPPAVAADSMRHGGWTETVSCDAISRDALITIVRTIAEEVRHREQ